MASRSSVVSGMQSNGDRVKHRGGGESGAVAKEKESQLPTRNLEGRSPEKKNGRERNSVGKKGKVHDSESVQAHFIDRSKLETTGDGSKKSGGGQRRRSSVSSHKLQLTEYIAPVVDSVPNDSLIESTSNAAAGEHMGFAKRRLKDVRNSLTASKEVVKVLFRILSEEEEQHSSGLTLVSALKVELDRARVQIDQLIHELRLSNSEVDGFMKQYAEEKAASKRREQERVKEATSTIASELEHERRMRKHAERLNRKLGSELADVRANLSKATKKLDNERRAREILEQTCNELAEGIGDDQEEVEELKRESEKAREEVEKERQMLQLADLLREERVQMKLAEARYEFEEKAAALERLRSELEGYFGNTGIKEIGDGSPYLEPSKEYADSLSKIIRSHQNEHGEQSEGEREGEEKEESGDSELHSIELNMDDKNKMYKWGFPRDNGSAQGDSRRPSVEEMFKGRKSLCEKIQWENICLYGNKQGNTDGSNKPRSSAVCPAVETNGCEDDAHTQRSGKSLKDHMYSSARGASHQSPLSPALESSIAGASLSDSKILVGFREKWFTT